MKVLVVTPFLPYPGVPHAGGKLVYRLLSTLAREHAVTLVSRRYPGEETHAAGLQEIVSGLETVPSEGPVERGSLPSLARTVASYRRLAGKAREALARERFDLCQVEHTETGVFFAPPPDLPSILTCHDVKARLARRRFLESRGLSVCASWLDWRAHLLLERRAVSRFRLVATLSEVDREWATSHYPGVRFRVLRYPGGADFLGLPRGEVPGRVLFVGALNRPENLDGIRYFHREVWPAIRERTTDSEFWVVGGGMPDAMRRELDGDPRIRVAGRVESVEEHYRSSSVFVAPILAGGGIIVKILDAMSAGVPVVTTPYGNEGIRARDGDEILVCERARDFGDAVVRLLERRDLRSSVGAAGRRFIERNFSPASFERDLRRIYDEALGRSAG